MRPKIAVLCVNYRWEKQLNIIIDSKSTTGYSLLRGTKHKELLSKYRDSLTSI